MLITRLARYRIGSVMSFLVGFVVLFILIKKCVDLFAKDNTGEDSQSIDCYQTSKNLENLEKREKRGQAPKYTKKYLTFN